VAEVERLAEQLVVQEGGGERRRVARLDELDEAAGARVVLEPPQVKAAALALAARSARRAR
jgi:hypothetical protein